MQQFKTLLFILAVVAGFMFSFGLNLKLFKFIDDLTGVLKHRNKIVIRSFAYLVFYYVMTSLILPRFTEVPAPSAVQGGEISGQKVDSASPEPLDADVDNTPGENRK